MNLILFLQKKVCLRALLLLVFVSQLFVFLFEAITLESLDGREAAKFLLFRGDRKGEHFRPEEFLRRDILPKSKCPSKCSNNGFIDHKKDIVIIGAGMSGIASASLLEKYSDHVDFVVLEANDYVGGRMRYHDFNGVSVEDGPNWIGGLAPNPMKILADEFGLHYFDHGSLSEYISYNGTTGDPISYKKLYDKKQKLYKALTCLLERRISASSERLRQHETENLKVALKKCGFQVEDEIDEVLSWFTFDLTNQAGINNVGFWSYPDFTEYDFLTEYGNYKQYFVSDRRGFQYLAEMFSKTRINKENIKLNSEICEVEHNENGATVKTFDCNRYHAKKVISTVATNVYLKRPGLFNPPIQTDSLPYAPAKYIKVFYKFNYAFWPNEQMINMILPTSKSGECGWFFNLNYYGQIDNDDDDIGVRQEGIYPGSNMLFCLIITEAVDRLGGRITKEIAMQFMKPLKLAFKEYYQDPIDIYIPDWDNDPFSYGLEYFSKDKSSYDHKKFFEPKSNNTLFISGSCSCHRYSGWTHGAYLSGIRSAMLAMKSLGITLSSERDELTSLPIKICDWEYPCFFQDVPCSLSTQCCDGLECRDSKCQKKPSS